MFFATVVMMGIHSIISLYEKKYISSFYLFFATCILTYNIIEQEIYNTQTETPLYIIIMFWFLIFGSALRAFEYILKNRMAK